MKNTQNEKDTSLSRQKALRTHRASRLGKEAILGETLGSGYSKNKKSGFD